MFRNWKPKFFDLQANMHRIAVPLVAPKRSHGQLPTQQPLLFSEPEPDYRAIALGFFSWLREFWNKTCHNLTRKSIADIPVRISLPSFGSIAHAESLLHDILSEAGWRLDTVNPVLPEPLSNIIGALSNGENAVMKASGNIDLGAMFRQTGLLERMRESTLGSGPRTAWVMIVDVGGYTTDFAMIGLDLTDLYNDLSEDIDGKPALRHLSRPLGITDLDKRMQLALPSAKGVAIEKRINDPDSYLLEMMHMNLYNKLSQPIGGGQAIGGTITEKKLVQNVIADFAADVAACAEDFLNAHSYDAIDDLILTGGGAQIETVRKIVVDRLRHYNVKRAHCHFPDEGKPFPAPYRRLDAQLPRGATAIGASSVYFDFST